MRSILNALQEGRLIELPDTDKTRSLEYLAHIIEAVPDLPGTPELTEAMMARERSMNTALGLGVACPHVRVPGSGELICALGWSPKGIDYGATDGKPVHLVVMYYIPDTEKNTYLKEVSSLARAINKEGGIQSIENAEEIGAVRDRLLDWVSAAIEAGMPEAKARMIRLEAKQAAVEAAATAPAPGAVQILPVMMLVEGDDRLVVLAQNAELTSALENGGGSLSELRALLKQQAQFERGGFRLIPKQSTVYGSGRTLYEYYAIKS